ncbi:MAG: DMT family transporter, partial [Pseudomonadota bacterium]
MTRPANLSDWAGLLALTAMWGSAFMLNEFALSAMPPAMVVAGRVSIAALVLFVLMTAGGVRMPAFGRAWIPMGVMAIFGTALPFQLIAWAQLHIDSAQAGVLMAVMPLFMLTLAHFFVPGSRLTGYRITGFVLGFAGVCIVIGPP